MFKFILINQTNFCGLLELQIIFINNTLILEYSLYVIKNRDIIPMVEQSLYNNAESKTVVAALPKELYKRGEMGLYAANEFVIALYKLFELTTEYIQINFPLFKIYLNQAQLRIIYNFINTYCQNYDLLMIKYQEIKPIITNTVTTETNNTTNVPVDNNNIMDDIIIYSPSKEVTNYLFKQILNNSNNYCVVTENAENYLIEFTPFLNIYKISFSKSGYSLFTQLFLTISLTENDYINNSKNIFQTLSYLLKNNLAASHKVEIQLCMSLLFIYFCKVKNIDFLSNLNRKVPVNFISIFTYNLQLALDSLASFTKFKQMMIKIKTNYEIDNNKLPDNVDKLVNQSAMKYSYLQSMDRDEFLKKVVIDSTLYRNTDLDGQQSAIYTGFITQNPIDIELIIKRNIKLQDVPLETYNLDYYLIEDKIISKAYYQLNKLIDNQTNKLLLAHELHPILNKYSDVIINKIIPNLNNSRELIEFNQSILVLYKLFVQNQFTDENIDNKNQMFILYQIVIPYLYDTLNKTKYIDCFH